MSAAQFGQPSEWARFLTRANQLVRQSGLVTDHVDELTSIWAANAGTVHPAGYRAMAHSMAEADLRDVLPRIEIPTLLLYGELDERSPLRVATELEAHIPAATLVVIPGVGHISKAEAPEALNACVREFLRSLDP